jgi:hypothetical protein
LSRARTSKRSGWTFRGFGVNEPHTNFKQEQYENRNRFSNFRSSHPRPGRPAARAAAEQGAKFKDDREKASYGIGANIGQNLKRSGMDVDVDILAGRSRT